MSRFPRTCAALLASTSATTFAGTVVVTSLPDETHPLAPLTSLPGTALSAGSQVSIGAFPGMTDDQILDASANGGIAGITGAFQTFGAPKAIGDGVDGSDGAFEIAVRQSTADPASPFPGQEVTLLIQKQDSQEFLVARFKGQAFAADPDTGLESQVSLHLADARLIVGNRRGPAAISTSTSPVSGSYPSWIGSYPGLTEESDTLPHADPDGDGRSNLLEYATGGDPSSPTDPSPCQIVTDESGTLWIRFSRVSGIGTLSHEVQESVSMDPSWSSLEADIEPDPSPPSFTGRAGWFRIRVPAPLRDRSFFRLNVKESD